MNFSGNEENKVYRGSLHPREPYYYIRASLDLSEKSINNQVYYFNVDNDWKYLDNPALYRNFYRVDDNALIGDVTVYSDLAFDAGSAFGPSNSQIVSVSRSSGVATIALNAAPSTFGLQNDDYVVISGILNNAGGFDSATPVKISVSGNNISYENGSGNYGGVRASGVQITTVARSAGGVATITLSVAPGTLGLVTGDYVTIAGITNDANSFNSAVPVQITVVGNTFTYSNATGSQPFVAQAAAGASRSVSLGVAAGASRKVETVPIAQIGGSNLANSLFDIWGGPTGNQSGSILMSDLENAQSCRAGGEPAPGAPLLALKLRGGSGSVVSGSLNVVVKVYVKF
jgi:hypothetical protein